MTTAKPLMLLALASVAIHSTAARATNLLTAPVVGDRVRTVVMSQTAARGTTNANFSTFSAPVLNNASQVAFFASLSGAGVTININHAGVWSEGTGP